MFALRAFVFFGGLFSTVACSQTPPYTLLHAARTEVMTTASCGSVEVEHVSASDVPEQREDVYAAEGCGMRWRMACGSQYVRHCKRHSNRCWTQREWDCSDIQPEDLETTDDELRTRITRPEKIDILGS